MGDSFLIQRLETRPDIPDAGRFLLPICLDKDELLKLVSSVERYMRHVSDFDKEPLLPVLQALEYIGRPENALCYSGAYDPKSCVEFPPFASFIKYFPDDPYIDDESVPAGYLTPAWWRWGEFETLLPDFLDDFIETTVDQFTGYRKNDAICWINSLLSLNIPAWLLEGYAYPAIEIYVDGSGTMEIEFLSIPLGSRAIIEVDNKPNILDVFTGGVLDPAIQAVDTARDMVSFPPEKSPNLRFPIDIPEDGEHTVYVMFLPVVDPELSEDLIGFGGGIRSVMLCGGLRPQNFPEPEPAPDLEGVTELKPEFRFTGDCGLEYRLVNQLGAIVQDWQPVTGWSDNAAACFAGIDGTNGEDGEDGEDGVNGNNYSPTSPTKPLDQATSYPQLSGDIVEPESGCDDSDKSRLWAAIKALVYKVHGYNQDLINSFTTFTVPSETYDTLSEFAPIIGSLAADLATSLATSLATNFKTSYNSAVTDAFLMDIVEDLFCDAYGDCSFSLEDFIAYVANMAGGTYDAAATSFLDITSALAGQTTGSGIFGALSWWQFQVLGLGEKFGISQSIPNIINSITGQAADDSWKAYATDCYTHSGTWTVVIDLSGDYVKTGSEVVYRNGLSLIKPSTPNSQGTAILEGSYGLGLHYSATSNQFANRELRIGNAGALFISCRINARKTGGTSTNMLIDCDSNTQANAPRQITSSSFAWTSGFPTSNAGGTAGAITRWSLNFNQTNSTNTCQGDLRYIEFTGTGELPTFI